MAESQPHRYVDKWRTRIDNTHIDGHANVHIGDVNWQYNTNDFRPGEQDPPDIKAFKTFLRLLAYERMNARVQNVAMALPSTCEWVRTHPQFQRWRDSSLVGEHNGFLWIKGKPGSGKSTIMRETLGWAQETWADENSISYFFNARSLEPLDRSSIGLYQSLLYQLLSQYKEIGVQFVKCLAWKTNEMAEYGWTETSLQNLLLRFFSICSIPEAITIFVDALDEGEVDDVRNMVGYLESLIESANSKAKAQKVRICLSSRHYPQITVRKCISLVMEDQSAHTDDIDLYIRKKLAGYDEPRMRELGRNISEKSAGIFLWVILVVSMLNKDYDQGSSAHEMHQRLKDIPKDLHHLFSQVVFKIQEGLPECICLFQWVMFAKGSMNAIELYQAVTRTCFPQRDLDSLCMEEEDMANAKRFVINCSRGLVEFERSNQTVAQFIHETVRDYLQSTIADILGLHNQANSIIQRFQLVADRCHELLAHVCLDTIFWTFKHSPEIVTPTILTLTTFPFYRYAMKFWWAHLKSVKNHCSPVVLDNAMQFMHQDTLVYRSWTKHYDENRDNRKRQAIVELEWRWDDCAIEAPPLVYAAHMGSKDLVRCILARGDDIHARRIPKNEHTYAVTALEVAVIEGHEDVVYALLAAGADPNLRGRFKLVLILATMLDHRRIVSMLLDAGADVNARTYDTALETAVRHNRKGVVCILLDAGANMNAPGGFRTALEIAKAEERTDMVDLLLSYKPDQRRI